MRDRITAREAFWCGCFWYASTMLLALFWGQVHSAIGDPLTWVIKYVASGLALTVALTFAHQTISGVHDG